MRKLVVIIAIILTVGFVSSGFSSYAAPKLFGDLGRTFFFKPVARYKPTNDVKAGNHHWFYFTNTTEKDQKFSGMITNLGPSSSDEWEIVQYCFSDACYAPLVEGTTGSPIKVGAKEEVSVQFAPHDKKSKLGQFGTSKIEVWAKDDPSIKDTMYAAVIFMPFTRAVMSINNPVMTVSRCLTWDPINRDKTKRYPLTTTEETLLVPPVIIDSSTYLPFRDMGEKLLGAKVDWDAKTRTAIYTIGDEEAYFKMLLPINNKQATLILKAGDGKILTDKVILSKPATIYKERTVVPLRGPVELFTAITSQTSIQEDPGILWDGNKKQVTLILPPPEKEQ